MRSDNWKGERRKGKQKMSKMPNKYHKMSKHTGQEESARGRAKK